MAFGRDDIRDLADAAPDRRIALAALVGGAGVAVFAAVDIAGDLGHTSGLHVFAEGAVFGVGLAAALWAVRALMQALLRQQQQHGAAVRALSAELEHSRAEAARFRAEAKDVLAGLGVALDKQFDRWGLTPAERETALLLLKGLSHKEIAEVRDVTEATARQQSRALYKKGGLTGRSDLAAFFLEDLLVPGGDAKRRPLSETPPPAPER